MKTFTYTVEVEAETEDQAEQVMAERIDFDEEMGFDYLVRWKPEAEEWVR